MKVKLSQQGDVWTAIDDDTYDGPGSPIGTGKTPGSAKLDLAARLTPSINCPEPVCSSMGICGCEQEWGERFDELLKSMEGA
jgi:hypothetical protein